MDHHLLNTVQMSQHSTHHPSISSLCWLSSLTSHPLHSCYPEEKLVFHNLVCSQMQFPDIQSALLADSFLSFYMLLLPPFVHVFYGSWSMSSAHLLCSPCSPPLPLSSPFPGGPSVSLLSLLSLTSWMLKVLSWVYQLCDLTWGTISERHLKRETLQEAS